MTRMQQDMPILFEGFRYQPEYPYHAVRCERGPADPECSEAL